MKEATTTDPNGTAPDGRAAEPLDGVGPVLPAAPDRDLRLSAQQAARMRLYAEQRRAAVNAENEALTNILIGLGLDLVRYEARLDDDGERVIVRERTS